MRSHPRGSFALAAFAVLAGLGAGPPEWLAGRWRAVESGWGLVARLEALEVRPAAGLRPAMVEAFDRDEKGRVRSWGVATLDASVGEPPPSRWLRAEWTSGASLVTLAMRPTADGRLTAIVRERPRARAGSAPEKVRQVVLEPDATRPVADAGRRAPVDRRGFEPDAPGPRGEALAGLFVVGVDGRGLRAVAVPDGFGRASHPCWSADGRWLAFAASNPDGRDSLIRVVAARGGPTTAIAAGNAPTWSADGARIAYNATGKPPFATDWDEPGTNDERVEAVRLAGPGKGTVEVLAAGLWPRFAPTDDRLAFVARVGGNNWEVFVRSADGLHQTRLTDHPALDTVPVWTADGKAIVFLSDRGNRWDLYRVPADGRGPTTRLTDHPRREEGADLSPDGETAAFTIRRDRPDAHVLLLDLATAVARPLLDPPSCDLDPSFSPDGHWLAFSSRRRPPGRP
ncbi:MAG TPA: hypothetical protein VG406_26490 [Isosphaeraceae bacterium]|jgi:hypothetical protein|nr:hypothetical protein [Isosphaeraceae bacterium]